MITMLIHVSFLLAAGAGDDVHDVPVRIELPRRSGVGDIGQRDRARLRARIIAEAVDRTGIRPTAVVGATFSFDDPSLASSIGYSQLTRCNDVNVVGRGPGSGRTAPLLRRALGQTQTA